jgi:hypothetical protein
MYEAYKILILIRFMLINATMRQFNFPLLRKANNCYDGLDITNSKPTLQELMLIFRNEYQVTVHKLYLNYSC